MQFIFKIFIYINFIDHPRALCWNFSMISNLSYHQEVIFCWAPGYLKQKIWPSTRRKGDPMNTMRGIRLPYGAQTARSETTRINNGRE